jgi:general L-amino acid transport system permease protein
LVDTQLWGGIFVSLLTALVGIVFSLPLGVLLALGRRSRLPIVKAACVVFIEGVRGVPFIAVLYMAENMLPLFLPPGWIPDRFIPPLVGAALFAAAYLAEEVRGGLQALPRGQYEGAMALGLSYWRLMGLVILPQALTLVIPGLVNNFIGLFKDTTLVASVGMVDFLAAIDNGLKDAVWSGPTLLTTGYAFAAAFYFVFCYAMSRYSAAIERRLALGRRQ